HMHLKDVDLAWARKVQEGSASYTDAVAAGMYVALGQGDVDITAIVRSLEQSGYEGWYVLEQDTVLAGDPADPTTAKGAGDPVADVRSSVAHLVGIAEGLSA